MPKGNLKFKAWMVENNIQQSEIAELLGIALQNANEKINNRQPWTLAQVKVICQKYGLSADVYFI